MSCILHGTGHLSRCFGLLVCLYRADNCSCAFFILNLTRTLRKIRVYFRYKVERDFLIFIWQNRLFESSNLVFSDGKNYEVVNCGLRFSDSDFVHAEFQSTDTAKPLRGTVRIDAKSSDWCAHHNPGAGSGVIAHIVLQRDKIILVGGSEILTCTVTPAASQIELLKSAPASCSGWLCEMDSARRELIFERLLIERLKRKSDRIASFAANTGDWNEAAYIAFMASLGYGGKRVAFENVALSLPLHYIERHFNRIELLEALLLGQAGFLNVRNADQYTENLQCEYNAARKANSLLCPPINWSKAGVRVHSAPAISLVRAAHILSSTDNLLRAITDSGDIESLRNIFRVPLPCYWANHYAPSLLTNIKGLDVISEARIDLLLINFVAPLLAAYGYAGDEKYVNRALDILEQVTAENNAHTRAWGPFKCRSAYVSQALIELKTEHCPERSCAACPLFCSYAIEPLG